MLTSCIFKRSKSEKITFWHPFAVFSSGKWVKFFISPTTGPFCSIYFATIVTRTPNLYKSPDLVQWVMRYGDLGASRVHIGPWLFRHVRPKLQDSYPSASNSLKQATRVTHASQLQLGGTYAGSMQKIHLFFRPQITPSGIMQSCCKSII